MAYKVTKNKFMNIHRRLCSQWIIHRAPYTRLVFTQISNWM